MHQRWSLCLRLFFQGYSERKLILIPCENAGVHWHIYGQQDEGCFDPFLVFGSLLEMSLWGIIYVLRLQCHLFNDLSGRTLNGCLLLSVPCQLAGPGCRLCTQLLRWVGGRGFSEVWAAHAFSPAKQLTCLLNFKHILVCLSALLKWGGGGGRWRAAGTYTQTCSLHMGRITGLCECRNAWAWALFAPEWVYERLPCLAADLSFSNTACDI